MDYGLLDKDGRLLGLRYPYRDNRTNAMIARTDEKVGNSAIYESTGIQLMFFNSLY